MFMARRRDDDQRWFILAFTLIILALVLARLAHAETPASLPTPPPVVGLLAGETAPNDGLLVPEATFKGYLHQKIDLEACDLRVASRDKAIADFLATPAPIAKGPDLGWKFTTGVAVGFVVGVVAAGAFTFAAIKVLQATQ